MHFIRRTRISHRERPSPLEVGFSGTRAGPFKSVAGQVTPCAPHALEYFFRGISPLMEPLLRAMNIPNAFMIWMYPLIMSHESAYYSVVALSQAYLENILTPAVRASPEVIYHRYKAVSFLRAHLSDLG